MVVVVHQDGHYACTSRWAVCLYRRVGSMLVPQGGCCVCTSRWMLCLYLKMGSVLVVLSKVLVPQGG